MNVAEKAQRVVVAAGQLDVELKSLVTANPADPTDEVLKDGRCVVIEALNQVVVRVGDDVARYKIAARVGPAPA